MKLSFGGRTVVVIGAPGGFGSATARTLPRPGRTWWSRISTRGAKEIADGLPSAIAVHPDATDLEATGRLDAGARVGLTANIPLGRIAEPHDVANAVVYLAPIRRRSSQGCLDVDGGRSIK
ncbi:hypothetical protein [Pseudonocardia sp. NPDC049154]|uniref:hypothetical protein n=1 Tax=Pseudonocardia sp. NPDC049154 TaxID=3155501 RepID=UPI0033F39E7D